MSEGLLRASGTVSVHPQWSQTEYGVKTVSVECFVSQDRSWTLISELSQGTPEMSIDLKWILEVKIYTFEQKHMCVWGPLDGYRVLVRLWAPNIDRNTTKSRSRVGSKKLQIFYIYFSVQQCPDFNWFTTLLHNFLGFHMILTSKYCDSEEEFIKNSPLLNALQNDTPDDT